MAVPAAASGAACGSAPWSVAPAKSRVMESPRTVITAESGDGGAGRREVPVGAGDGAAVRLEDPGPLGFRKPVEEGRDVVAGGPDRGVVPADHPGDRAMSVGGDGGVGGPRIAVEQGVGPAKALQQADPPGQLLAELVEPGKQAVSSRPLLQSRVDPGRGELFENRDRIADAGDEIPGAEAAA